MGNNASNNVVGIYLFNSDYSELISNNVTYNAVGITVSYSDYNEIKGNYFSFNSQIGMRLYFTDYNEIIGNYLTNNDQYGILIGSISTFNNIYFNNIEKNSIDDIFPTLNGQNNKWDNGVFGNYWGNYINRNPGATNDGSIWNTPYEIGNEQDNFPLVQPFVSETENLLPIAEFRADTISSNINELVLFSFIGSDGNNPTSFQWNFGDGTENSTLRNPGHNFTKIGSFTITLKVTDSNGDISYTIKENYIQITQENTNPDPDPVDNSTSNLSVTTVGIIIGVCVAVGAAGIGVFAYKRKSKVSLKVSKDGSKIKSVTIQIETLSQLFKSSDSVKIEEAADLTGLNRVEFLNFLIDNRSSLKGLTIDGDVLTMNSEEDVNEFVNLLDEQFETWKNKEKSKTGKI